MGLQVNDLISAVVIGIIDGLSSIFSVLVS